MAKPNASKVVGGAWHIVRRLAVLAPLACGANADAAETSIQALRESDLLVDFRLRYENVDQAGIAEAADALTGRLRLGVQTAPLRKTSLLGEAVWIEALRDGYNDTLNGATQYPVVADPDDLVAINRFALVNESLPGTKLTVGRQRIVHDDARFVGNVGWRQHEQTFDALRAEIDAAAKLDLTYAAQINRVFGPDSPQGKWEGDVVLASMSIPTPAGALSVFDHYLDIDEMPAASTNTAGLRLSGSRPLGRLQASYALGIARQSDVANNPADIAETWSLIEGGLSFGKLGVWAGIETLGGDGTVAFTTPLATLHAFQGWADKFLATPPDGIEDRYLRLSYALPKDGPFTAVSLLGLYHDYAADASSAEYGDELNLQLVARTPRLVLTLKYATYRAAALLTDTDKLWMSLDVAF
ncbi:MAG TPA: alginate export family protein [Gammaproteobacteria bacterium]